MLLMILINKIKKAYSMYLDNSLSPQNALTMIIEAVLKYESEGNTNG